MLLQVNQHFKEVQEFLIQVLEDHTLRVSNLIPYKP